jgi:cytochrome b
MSEAVRLAPAGAGAGLPGRVRVWDPLVRLAHWGLVAAVAAAWASADEVPPLHEVAGYAAGALVAVRLVWGVVGSRHARFAGFVTGPRATLAHLGAMARGAERRHLGHNPAGAAMIVALLATLSATAVTGWLLAEPGRLAMLPDLPQVVAPALAGDHDARDDVEDALEEVHEALANLLLLLAALHVGGVALASWRHRENLVRAMLTGDKRAPGPGDIA